MRPVAFRAEVQASSLPGGPSPVVARNEEPPAVGPRPNFALACVRRRHFGPLRAPRRAFGPFLVRGLPRLPPPAVAASESVPVPGFGFLRSTFSAFGSFLPLAFLRLAALLTIGGS